MNLELHKSKNLLKILNTAIDAGKEIQKVYKKSFNVEIKDDNSPITEADIKSNNLILNRLKSFSPNVPILSEESLIEWKERKTWNSYWLIDPLDGTKEFIKKNGEFTVNIALIKNNSPIFGIIYAPAKSLLYYALKNNGAYKLITESNIETTKDFIKINSVKDKSNLTKVIGSRSHSNKDFDNWYEKEHLSEAKQSFSAISALRGWEIENEDIHYAYYEFDNVKKANEILKSEALKKMISIYDKKWSNQIDRTRKIITITQEI